MNEYPVDWRVIASAVKVKAGWIRCDSPLPNHILCGMVGRVPGDCEGYLPPDNVIGQSA